MKAIAAKVKGGALVCPEVGEWTPSVRNGQLIRGGDKLGSVRQLANILSIMVPDDIAGEAQDVHPFGNVDTGSMLVEVSELGGIESSRNQTAAISTSNIIRAGLGGRFYAKPSPDEPAFVKVGDVLTHGTTIGLIEVMKTFHPLVYSASYGPDNAKVSAILIEDSADIEESTPLLRFEV